MSLFELLLQLVIEERRIMKIMTRRRRRSSTLAVEETGGEKKHRSTFPQFSQFFLYLFTEFRAADAVDEQPQRIWNAPVKENAVGTYYHNKTTTRTEFYRVFLPSFLVGGRRINQSRVDKDPPREGHRHFPPHLCVTEFYRVFFFSNIDSISTRDRLRQVFLFLLHKLNHL